MFNILRRPILAAYRFANAVSTVWWLWVIFAGLFFVVSLYAVIVIVAAIICLVFGLWGLVQASRDGHLDAPGVLPPSAPLSEIADALADEHAQITDGEPSPMFIATHYVSKENVYLTLDGPPMDWGTFQCEARGPDDKHSMVLKPKFQPSGPKVGMKSARVEFPKGFWGEGESDYLLVPGRYTVRWLNDMSGFTAMATDAFDYPDEIEGTVRGDR